MEVRQIEIKYNVNKKQKQQWKKKTDVIFEPIFRNVTVLCIDHVVCCFFNSLVSIQHLYSKVVQV